MKTKISFNERNPAAAPIFNFEYVTKHPGVYKTTNTHDEVYLVSLELENNNLIFVNNKNGEVGIVPSVNYWGNHNFIRAEKDLVLTFSN